MRLYQNVDLLQVAYCYSSLWTRWICFWDGFLWRRGSGSGWQTCWCSGNFALLLLPRGISGLFGKIILLTLPGAATGAATCSWRIVDICFHVLNFYLEGSFVFVGLYVAFVTNCKKVGPLVGLVAPRVGWGVVSLPSSCGFSPLLLCNLLLSRTSSVIKIKSLKS